MKLEIIKDRIGNSYIGIDVTNDISILNTFTILDKSYDIKTWFKDNNIDFKQCLQNNMDRNGNKLHITIFNVAECHKDPNLLQFDGFPLIEDVINKGIGFIKKDDKFTIFNVVESTGLDRMRELLKLKKRDLHITLGFTHKDLFHERKNIANLFQLGVYTDSNEL